jgi:hypothetical protein
MVLRRWWRWKKSGGRWRRDDCEQRTWVIVAIVVGGVRAVGRGGGGSPGVLRVQTRGRQRGRRDSRCCYRRCRYHRYPRQWWVDLGSKYICKCMKYPFGVL